MTINTDKTRQEEPTFSPEIRTLAYAMQNMSHKELCETIVDIDEKAHRIGFNNGEFAMKNTVNQQVLAALDKVKRKAPERKGMNKIPTDSFDVAESRSGRDCPDCGEYYHTNEEINECTCHIHNSAVEDFYYAIEEIEKEYKV